MAAVIKYRSNFPVDARDRWADALGLSGDDREQFLVTAAFAVLDETGLREVKRLRELAGVGQSIQRLLAEIPPHLLTH